MKKYLIILLTAIVSMFIACNKIENEPTGNARLSIKGITFHELSAAEKLEGKVTTTTYTSTDTSTSLVVEKSTATFNITAPIDFNQFYDYNLPAGIKKIKFDISFHVKGTTAGNVTVDEINFIFNGVNHYDEKGFSVPIPGETFVLPTIELNF